jgi:hypothetical protein
MRRTGVLLRMRWVLAVLFCLGLLVWLVHAQRIHIPPRYDPFAPLDLADEPNLLTRFKQARAARDPALCRATLEAGNFVRATPVPDRTTESGCAIENAFAVAALDGATAPRFVATCRLTVALSLWLRHEVQPAAARVLGTRVVRLEHFGSYACRTIQHRENGPLSRHATADAVDIAAFVLADGRRVKVTAWSSETPEARFLHAARDGACRFASVLSPDYNEAHANHLHIEVGGWALCR